MTSRPTVGIALTGELADLVAGIEDELRDVVGRCRELAPMDFVPQAQVALAAGYEP